VHGWKFIQKRIYPDHLVLVVEVWPNHSPEQVAQRAILYEGHADGLV
jgi:hypothetical protein